ncbi:MAG: hypothetical protein IJG60_05745 [Thermoguttaceae bacterium]|nr:hypothetical protein [Thermoguttaceae bacterium]
MAKHNPFRIFRKNQKAWLAGLTLFTMFSFIALGSMFQCLQVVTRSGQGSFLAKTKTIGNFDYVSLHVQQDEVNRLYTFLQTAMSAMATANPPLLASQGNLIFTLEGPADKPEEQIPVILDQLMVLMGELTETLNGNNAENLVNRWLVIESGRKAGLAPSENNVRDYLAQLFGGKLYEAQFRQALAAAGLRQDGLVILLKNQLIYDWMLRRADGGWRSDPITALTVMPTGHGPLAAVPGEQAEAASRLYRSLKADAAVFPVENYFEQIPDPTEEEAHAFFEKYKNVPWSETSDQPGFYQPTKVSYEVVTANLTDELLDAVTDEEIAAYYEAHLEDFARPIRSEEAPPAPAIEGADEFELPDDLEATDVAGPGDLSPEEGAGAAPAEEAPAEGTPAEEAPAETAPAGETPVEEAPAEDAGEETSAAENTSPFRLVSYEEENAGEAAPEAAEEAAEDAAEAAEEAAEEAEDAAEEAEEAAGDAAEEAEDAAGDAAEEELKLDEAGSEPPAESAYYPLDEVKEGIRRQIAVEKLTSQLEEIQAEMEEYARRLANKRANVSAGNTELTDLDLQKAAEEKGFVYYLSSIADEEGNAVPALLTMNEAAASRTLPFQTLAEIYNSSVMDYSPRITPVIEDKIHLYWITELKSEHVPEYGEVEGLVVATWKKEKAETLAEKDAEALCERIASEGKSLEEIAQEDGESAKYLFAKTEPFTQYELPRASRNPNVAYGEVREEGVAPGESFYENKALTAIGSDFYDAAYALGQGEAGVCFNAPKDRAVTLQITERDDDASVFEKVAAAPGGVVDTNALQTIRLMQNLKFQEDWIEQLRKDVGFQWVTLPGRIR